MPQRLYVYYQVPSQQLAVTVAAVRAMQVTLQRQFPGLVAELLCRPEERDGRLTLMETYRGADDMPGLSAALAAAAAAAALPQPRHEERFETLA